MAELLFPPSQLAEQQSPTPFEFGPQTSPYRTDNGLTYFYDVEKDAWTLKRGMAVTQDDLDDKLKEKVSVTGGSIIGSGRALSFTETPTSSTPERIVLEVDGNIILNSDNKNIVFNDLNSGPASIYGFSGPGFINPKEPNENKYLEIASKGIVFHESLYFTETSPRVLISHSQNPTPEESLIVMDLHSTGDYKGMNEIRMSARNGLQFTFNDQPLLELNTDAQGRVKIKPNSNNDKTFTVVQNNDVDTGKVEGATVFRVDTNSHKVFCTEDYNAGLISGEIGARVSGSNYSHVFTEDNLVATVGFVKEGYFKPGMNVFASNEEDCEVGGLWTDGFNYYVKVEDATVPVD